jgi:hypothetical protein
MGPKELLELTYGLTLPEANRRLPRGSWGKVYPVVTLGRVVGLVTILEPEVWFRPCSGPDGLRKVIGSWRLMPRPGHYVGLNGWSHAVLDNKTV